MDRIKNDIVGFFFTNADIFFLSFFIIGWRGKDGIPASLDM